MRLSGLLACKDVVPWQEAESRPKPVPYEWEMGHGRGVLLLESLEELRRCSPVV